MLIKGTKNLDVLQGGELNDTIQGNGGDDYLFGYDGDDLVIGGVGNDNLFGGKVNQDFIVGGGSDTLVGGEGSDAYIISLTDGGGTIVKETSNNEDDDDIVLIFADNANIKQLESINAFSTEDEILEVNKNPDAWGDAFLKLSSPKKGIVGLRKFGNDLIIDLNRDGVAKTSDDLTITNYFNDQGELSKGAPFAINNIADQQDIVDFFA
jgi:Ca2+-binding RTX toxin-like protein